MTRPPASGAPERPFAHLAQHLIALRRAARLPQRALAQAANISRGAVQRAESGTAAPSMAVLDAYVRACGASPPDQTRARILRTRGRTAQRDRLRHLKAPAPALIHTDDDLGAALAAAYERAGAPCLSDARLAPGRTPLPRTTAWRIVERKKLPPTAEQLVTFLTACGISPAEQRPYIDAYQRITADRSNHPTPPRRRPAGHLHRIPLSHGGTDEPPHFTDKISPGFRTLLNNMTAEEVETALTVGTAYLVAAKARRNGTTPPPATLSHVFRVAHQLADTGADLMETAPTSGILARRTAHDDGVELFTHTTDDGTAVLQLKHHHRPGPPPLQTLATASPSPPPASRAR